MKDLIKKIYFFVIILNINHFFTLVASALPHTVSLPKDVKKLVICVITKSFYDETKYVIEDYRKNRNHEELIIPYTIRPISLVKAITVGNIDNGPVPLAEPGDNCYLDVQLWFKVSSTIFTKKVNWDLRLHKDTQSIDHPFFINDLPHCRNQLFDGMNVDGSAVLAQTTRHDHVIYLINPHAIKKYGKIHNPIYKGNGRLWSIMLHPTEDKIVFSTRHRNDQYNEKPFKITIGDVTPVKDDVIFTIDTETYLNFLICKTIYLGKQTYLCVTDEGKLVVLWQDKNGIIQHASQKHSSKMIDIAVDNTVVTEKGFHPHIACLNNKGDLFVCNLLAFAQPTLFFIKNANLKKQHAFRLFHDSGKCGILYRECNNTGGTGKYTDFIVWPDNLNEMCAVWNWQNRK